MPLLVAAIVGAIGQAMASIIGRALVALFIGYVTFSGFDTLFSYASNLAKSNLSSLPSEIYLFLTWLWVDKAINLITSAFTAALAVKMAGSANITKMVVKR